MRIRGERRLGRAGRRGVLAMLLLAGLCLPLTAQPPLDAGDGGERELVVLVHGLGRTSASMLPLKWALERAGFEVLNWGYSSMEAGLPELGERLAQRVEEELDRAPYQRVHWVGHSLGGILIRWALVHHPTLRRGRVVMLAPPNQGSHSADRYAPLMGWLLQPLPDLRTDSASVVRRLAVPADVEVGVIAAVYDGKVHVEETHLPGATDHLVAFGWHTFLMAQPSVQQQVLHFLRSGRFERPSDER